MPDLSLKQIKEVAKLIHEKEALEVRIDAILGKNAPLKGSPKVAAAPAAEEPKKTVTRAPSNARQLQGKYMGKIKAFTGQERKNIEAIKLEQGIEAALAAMESKPRSTNNPEAPAAELPKAPELDFADAGAEV